MANQLKPTIRAYMQDDISKRYVRPDEVCNLLKISDADVKQLARSSGSLYELPRISLIHLGRLEDYMKHMRKVPGSSKFVQKEFVRIGEGSIMYSIGRHRFIEMARAAGAVYKINEGTGGTVLVNLELFDKYMEQFREEAIPMKTPLWKPEEVE